MLYLALVNLFFIVGELLDLTSNCGNGGQVEGTSVQINIDERLSALSLGRVGDIDVSLRACI